MREILEQNEEIFLTNNYYSADLVGFTPGEALSRITLPAIDNALPWRSAMKRACGTCRCSALWV